MVGRSAPAWKARDLTGTGNEPSPDAAPQAPSISGVTGTFLRRYGPDLVLAMLWAAFGIYWLTRGDDPLLGWMHLFLAVGWLVRILMPERSKARSIATVATIVVALAFLAFSMSDLLQGQ